MHRNSYGVNFIYLYVKLILIAEKYDLVGRLLKPGEAPTNYSDEEEEPAAASNEKEKKED